MRKRNWGERLINFTPIEYSLVAGAYVVYAAIILGTILVSIGFFLAIVSGVLWEPLATDIEIFVDNAILWIFHNPTMELLLGGLALVVVYLIVVGTLFFVLDGAYQIKESL